MLCLHQRLSQSLARGICSRTQPSTLMKTVAVLGGSYGGLAAAQLLAKELPDDWRVVLVDRNSHFNHLYVLPRYAILPVHAHKAFIPYTNALGSRIPTDGGDLNGPIRHVFLRAQVTSLSEHSATLSQSFPEAGVDGEKPELYFDYALYALGSHLPAPIDLWGPVQDKTVLDCGTKQGGIEWLREYNKIIEQAATILVVGGGPLGIQYATDIAEVFPTKSVTLLHSRERLMPRFDEVMHEEVLSTLSLLNVQTILGDRLDLTTLNTPSVIKDGKQVRTVKTQSGREISANFILLCTGQTPNTAMLKEFLPDCIAPDGPFKGMAYVKRTMQIAVLSPILSGFTASHSKTEQCADEDDDAHLTVPYPHLFVIGDAADAFGAINAGHTAYFQAELAARNILALIKHSTATSSVDKAEVELERYHPGLPSIKISIGLTRALFQVDGAVGRKAEVPEDLDAAYMWKVYGADTEEGMYV